MESVLHQITIKTVKLELPFKSLVSQEGFCAIQLSLENKQETNIQRNIKDFLNGSILLLLLQQD